MAYNGSGTFLINTAGQPVVAGTVISSTAFNALTADLATGLSTVITKDGQTTVTANIPMSTYKFTGLGVGSAAGDSANLSQVQSTVTKLLTSVSGADTITAVGAPVVAAYAAGQMFYFVATGDNTGAVTLNIDALGAKAVTRDGSVALVAGDIKSGEVVVVVYDGTRFQVVSQLNSAGNATFANVSITSALNVGGVATFSAGSAAAPSITTTGDTNTGIFFPAADTIAFTEGGVEAARFDSSGNLGIGTTSPLRRLAIAGDAQVYNTAADGASNTVIGRLTSQVRNYGTNIATASFASIEFATGTWPTGNIRFLTNGTDGTDGAGTERMRLDSSGNLGIGTSSPSQRLDVAGNVISTAWIGRANGSAPTADAAVYRAADNTLAFATASNERARIDSSGNLGIGTTSPQSKLHVDGGEYINSAGTLPALSTSIVSGEIHAGITNTATTDSGYLRLSAGGGTTLGVKAALDIFRESGGTAGIVGYTSGTERFRIDANGNVVAGASAALATNATNGFLYVPTCAGTPTGTPTAITGMAPIVVDTTNNKLYFYSTGVWRDAGP